MPTMQFTKANIMRNFYKTQQFGDSFSYGGSMSSREIYTRMHTFLRYVTKVFLKYY